MLSVPLVIDLYCGEGGAAAGYAAAGFDVIGIDLNDDWSDRRSRPRPQPLQRYPFRSLSADAITVLEQLLAGEALRVSGSIFQPACDVYLDDVALFHASPPCQLHSSISRLSGRQEHHVELIAPTRALLEESGRPWVIENVEGAPVAEASVRLCGSMFEPPLDVQRHRLFEASWPLDAPGPCRHHLWTPRFRSADYRGRNSGKLMKVVPVYGGTRYPGDLELRRRAMECPWMSNHGVVEAIPPRYTTWVGERFLALTTAAAA